MKVLKNIFPWFVTEGPQWPCSGCWEILFISQIDLLDWLSTLWLESDQFWPCLAQIWDIVLCDIKCKPTCNSVGLNFLKFTPDVALQVQGNLKSRLREQSNTSTKSTLTHKQLCQDFGWQLQQGLYKMRSNTCLNGASLSLACHLVDNLQQIRLKANAITS